MWGNLEVFTSHQEQTYVYIRVSYFTEELIVLQSQIEESQAFFRQAFDDERLRSEHLEEQLNDMMELHQHEVTNIKQVLIMLHYSCVISAADDQLLLLTSSILPAPLHAFLIS